MLMQSFDFLMLHENYGCKLELISLKPDNFAAAAACHPDICEFLHTSDFRAIEEDYLNNIKLF